MFRAGRTSTNAVYISTSNIDHTIELSCVRLRFAVSSLLIIALVHFRELLETMESEDSVRALHAKLQQEIRRSLDEAQVNEEELASLRHNCKRVSFL